MCSCCNRFFCKRCCCRKKVVPADPNAFTYENLDQGGIVISGDYRGLAAARDRMSLMRPTIVDAQTGKGEDEKKQGDFGWKFHISFDDEDPENVRKGWNAIVPILIKYQIALTKVLKTNYRDSAHHPHEWGRHVTIYARLNQLSPAQWT